MELEFPTDLDVVIARPEGLFTLDAALQWAPSLLGDSRFHIGMPQVYDLSRLEVENTTFERIQTVVEELARRPRYSDAMIAYVAPQDLIYGLARMFVAISSTDLPRRRNLFRTLEDALDWIRLEDRDTIRG
ncbi:MAG: hypothetical protein U5R48_09195 [Gammaproteobacteria bacterium]|nr:hypothetical protein [Gammaproteobacteria bacterium]